MYIFYSRLTHISRPFTLISPILTIYFALVLFGCSRTIPTVPRLDQFDPDPDLLNAPEQYTESHHIWGEWSVVIDGATGTIEIAPVRNIGAHWDVTGFLKPPECSNCLSFHDLTFIESDLVSVFVTLTHPFPGMQSLDGFDVKGVGLGEPDLDFSSGSVSQFIENADGYTSRWSHDPWANINPYLDYATDDPERSFANDSTHEREFIARLPIDGVLQFDYIIDACWLPPGQVDPQNPALSPHCNEAWGVNVLVSGPINGHALAFAEIEIEFNDWQNDGESADVTVEIPGVISNPIAFDLYDSGSPISFGYRIYNELGASPGAYPALLSIRDELNDPSNDWLTTFQHFKIIVTDETPAITWIEIDPDEFSLPDQYSNMELQVVAHYSDNGSSIVADGINWLVSGTDLNGNPLAHVDNGLVTRLSSKWWGGIATVTAEYQDHQAQAIAYCEDPFADAVDVEFGAFNEPGNTFTQPQSLIGPPAGAGSGGGSLYVCSLGYGGIAILEFTDSIIVDEPGPDLIVFENAFYCGGCDWNGDYQYATWNETALVEVSQDGISWFRFPCDYNPDNITCGIEPYMNTSSFYGIAGVNPVYANVYPDGSLKDGIDPTDPDTAGGDAFDLADVGLEWCRFVKLIDTGDWEDAPGTEQYDDNGDLILDFGKMSILGAAPNKAGFDGDSVAAVHSASPLTVQ